jgi:hypothetical protein
MDWIFPAFVLAAVLHILEEYVYPGGFPDFMKGMAPRFASSITTEFAVVINGGFLLLCLSAAVFGPSTPVFSLSIAALLFINGLTHFLGSLRLRGYAPGAITGVLLYMPLAVMAYSLFLRSGELSLGQLVLSILLGVAYQAVPLGVLAFASISDRR